MGRSPSIVFGDAPVAPYHTPWSFTRVYESIVIADLQKSICNFWDLLEAPDSPGCFPNPSLVQVQLPSKSGSPVTPPSRANEQHKRGSE